VCRSTTHVELSSPRAERVPFDSLRSVCVGRAGGVARVARRVARGTLAVMVAVVVLVAVLGAPTAEGCFGIQARA
jgi:hypothetical protein